MPDTAAMPGDYRACDELGAIARPFSPLVRELLALYCHTRPIGALSQTENCRDEYQMTARSIIHHILEGWQNQTDGRGTIDDLLLRPRTTRLLHPQEAAARRKPDAEQYRHASRLVQATSLSSTLPFWQTLTGPQGAVAPQPWRACGAPQGARGRPRANR